MLVLSPKLHTGYLSLPILLMTPLLSRHKLAAPYFIVGTLAIIADLLKFPCEQFTAAFATMIGCLFTLVLVAVRIRLRPSGAKDQSPWS